MPSVTRRRAVAAAAGALGTLGGCGALGHDDSAPITTTWERRLRRPSSVGLAADGALLASSHGPFADLPAVARLDPATGATQWAVTLPKGWRSPVAVRGRRAYVAAETGLVAAVDTTTGEVAWRHDLGWVAEPGDSAVAFPPVPSGDRVVVPVSPDDSDDVDSEDRLVGLAADGTRVFDHRLGVALAAVPAATRQGVIAATLDGSLRRVAPDGETAWRRSLTPGSSPVAVVDDTAYLATAGERVVAVDTVAGTTRWTAPLANTGFSRPLVADDRVYVGGADYSLRAFAAADGRELWRDDLANAVTHGPVAVGDRLVTLVGGKRAVRGVSGVVTHDPVVCYVHERDGTRVRAVRLTDSRVEWLAGAGETVYLGGTFRLVRVAREAITDG